MVRRGIAALDASPRDARELRRLRAAGPEHRARRRHPDGEGASGPASRIGRVLATTVSADLPGGLIVVELCGRLDRAAETKVRDTLLTCFAQAPDAVVVDVSQLSVAQPSRLAVFAALGRTGRHDGAALLLCAPSIPLAPLMIPPVIKGLAVYPTRKQALRAAAGRHVSTGRKWLRLAPTKDAPSAARELVRRACDAWRIAGAAPAAELVTSELVTNAVRHAQTDLEITVVLRHERLHLSVRDWCRRPPRPPADGTYVDDDPARENGRGLHLVEICTEGWGTVWTRDGKIVWATLRAPADPTG